MHSTAVSRPLKVKSVLTANKMEVLL